MATGGNCDSTSVSVAGLSRNLLDYAISLKTIWTWSSFRQWENKLRKEVTFEYGKEFIISWKYISLTLALAPELRWALIYLLRTATSHRERVEKQMKELELMKCKYEGNSLCELMWGQFFALEDKIGPYQAYSYFTGKALGINREDLMLQGLAVEHVSFHAEGFNLGIKHIIRNIKKRLRIVTEGNTEDSGIIVEDQELLHELLTLFRKIEQNRSNCSQPSKTAELGGAIVHRLHVTSFSPLEIMFLLSSVSPFLYHRFRDKIEWIEKTLSYTDDKLFSKSVTWFREFLIDTTLIQLERDWYRRFLRKVRH